MSLNKMDINTLSTLLEKYEKATCTEEELLFLINYFESFQEDKSWPEAHESSRVVKERIQSKLKNAIAPKKRRIHKLMSLDFYRYAAVFVIGFFIAKTIFTDEKVPVVEIPEDAITLTLDDGTVKVIDANTRMDVYNEDGNKVGVQSKSTIVYQEAAQVDELVYNQLNVPLGERFQIVLSDGTEIQLNAGASLKYPVQFLPGNKREVFLNGEAYFDVSKDKKHPFLVHSDDVEVAVLGTQFNMSTYPEDEFVNTVLLEGSVKVTDQKNRENTIVIVPNQKASLAKNNRELVVEEVAVGAYVAWIQGELNFKGIPFGIMLKKIERSYGVKITCNDEDLKQQIFRSRFDTEIETVDDILLYISKIHPFNYTISDTEITINPISLTNSKE